MRSESNGTVKDLNLSNRVKVIDTVIQLLSFSEQKSCNIFHKLADKTDELGEVRYMNQTSESKILFIPRKHKQKNVGVITLST